MDKSCCCWHSFCFTWFLWLEAGLGQKSSGVKLGFQGRLARGSWGSAVPCLLLRTLERAPELLATRGLAGASVSRLPGGE